MSDVVRATNTQPPAEESGSGMLSTVIYEELRILARQKMARESPGKTIQATMLVHEAWLRLGGDQQPKWESKAHFFAAAAEAMRRILIDNARRKKALRHGGHVEQLSVDELEIAIPFGPDDEILALNEALDRFAAEDPVKTELVKLCFFAGLTIEEAADVLSISPATAKRYWAFARAWLYREMNNHAAL